MPLTKEVLSKYPNKVFIETGAYEGAGIHLARELGFEKIYSIEILSYRVDQLTEIFKNDPVQMIHGDSSVVLPELIKTIPKATIWLDAHESTEIIYGNKYPLSKELECLYNTNHTILID